MPLFAVIGLDDITHSEERRLAEQSAHRTYVVNNDADIALVGPMLDGDGKLCGSFYLFEAESEAAVHDWLAQEPYVRGGVYQDLIVRRFEVGKSRLEAQEWPIARPAQAHGGGVKA